MFSHGEWEKTSPLIMMLHVSAEPGTGLEKFRAKSEDSCTILCIEAETMAETRKRKALGRSEMLNISHEDHHVVTRKRINVFGRSWSKDMCSMELSARLHWGGACSIG